ncbi:MAG: hypothetical protein HC824_19660 [Synechococcales cyanobacterium RM1_1_8]|nr:hypothetical protein [Synechococcales cyanobacterium RM1_1_8]
MPYDSGQPAGVGAIFAQAPLALRSLLDHSPPAFLDILTEEGATLLLTAFVAFLGELNQWQGLHPWGQHCPVELQPLAGHRPWVGDRLGGDFPGRDAMANPATAPALGLTLGDLGLRTVHLEQTLHSDLLAALFTGHVPARFSLDLQQPLGANVGRIRMELDGLEIALTHRQDLSLALRPITSASAYPVLVELVADISDAPHTLGQALTVQFTEEGDACNWFYNPAILTEEEVELMQQRFLAILNAIAQAPQTPLGQVLGLTTEAGVVEV